jgi:DNA mismatch endonuclease, patch repair protein
VDRLSKERRSWNMSRIRGGDTVPEKLVRSVLHRLGFRFRLHVKSLPGKPDIVLPRYRTVVFVHGCFWHRHGSCKFAYNPKTRVDFWARKFAGNIERDRAALRALRRSGEQVIVVWECQTRDRVALSRRLDSLLKTQRSAQQRRRLRQ